MFSHNQLITVLCFSLSVLSTVRWSMASDSVEDLSTC